MRSGSGSGGGAIGGFIVGTHIATPKPQSYSLAAWHAPREPERGLVRTVAACGDTRALGQPIPTTVMLPNERMRG